jgi:glycyl-tRNA synthetase beta chain
MKASAKENRVELLFEVGCEEIPAGMLPKAEEELRTNIEKLLTAENLFDGVSVETFSAPRRLTAWVRGLFAKQADVEVEISGPPKSVAYDSVGAPTRAALSFAEKQRVHVSDLYLVQTPKGEYLAAKQIKLGRTAEQILVAILPRAVHDLTWPRSMTWTGLDGPRFIRPIRWVVAVLDGKPLKLSVAGIAAGRSTRGHRFLGSSAIPVKHDSSITASSSARPAARRKSRRSLKPMPSGGITAFTKTLRCDNW